MIGQKTRLMDKVFICIQSIYHMCYARQYLKRSDLLQHTNKWFAKNTKAINIYTFVY